MLSVNRATILGNLTRDPEIRYTPSGQAVANFGVATNRRWKTPTGELQEQTEFHDIVAWGKLAEQSNQMLKKGSPVYIEGRLQTRSWEAPDGTKRYRTEIVAQLISALGPRSQSATAMPDVVTDEPTQAPPMTPLTDSESKANDQTDHQDPEKTKKSKTTQANESADASDEINLDDIPF